MDYRNRITIEPDKVSGKPCIRGFRISRYMTSSTISHPA